MYTPKTFVKTVILRQPEALAQASRARTIADVAKLNELQAKGGTPDELKHALVLTPDDFENRLPATVSGGKGSLLPLSEDSVEIRKYLAGALDAKQLQALTGDASATSGARIGVSLPSAEEKGIAPSMVRKLFGEAERITDEDGKTALQKPMGVFDITTGSGHDAEETMSSFEALLRGEVSSYTLQYNDQASVESLAEAAHLGAEQVRTMLTEWQKAAPDQKKFVAAESLANAAFYKAFKGHLLELGDPSSGYPLHLDGGIFMGVPGKVNKHMFKELFGTSVPKEGMISRDGNWALVDGQQDPKTWNTTSLVDGKEVKARFIVCNNFATDPVPRMGNMRSLLQLALHKPPHWPEGLPYKHVATAVKSVVGLSAATHIKAGAGAGEDALHLGNVGHDYSLNKADIVRAALEAQGVEVPDQLVSATKQLQSDHQKELQGAK